MARLRTPFLAVALTVVLASAEGRAEDLFSLLEPEAFATHGAEAPNEPAVSEPSEKPAEEPAPAGEEGVKEDVEESPDEQMLTALVDAIPFEVPAGPGLVMVSDELEFIPTPIQLAAPSQAMPSLAEPVPPVVVEPTTALSRSILGVTLDASADSKLVEQMAKIPDNFAIKDAAADHFGSWDAPAREATQTPPRFAGTLSTFAAPAAYSRPLYFEEHNLERYGHHVAFCEHDNLTQSALSAAHFFATIPVLPYKMGANHPDECNYVLGTYRPGSCNPHQLLKPQLSVGGGVAEGIAVTGLIFLIP